MSAVADDLAAVIAARRRSRAVLAAELAGAFRHDPRKFDPRSLERLGASGLRQFLGEVGATGVLSAAKEADARIPRSPSMAKAPGAGWRHLRCAEWPVWITGVAAGLRAGAMVTGAGLFILFSAERIAPVLRELL